LPERAGVAYSYSITSGPDFVKINGTQSNQIISIYTTDGAKTGDYSVTVKATEVNSELTNE